MTNEVEREKEIELYKAQLAAELEKHKAQLSKEHAHYEAICNSKLEEWKVKSDLHTQTSIASFQGVIQFAEICIKAVIITNGGAVIALLAFVGSLWTGENKVPVELSSALSKSLALFSYGVGAGIVTSGFAYVTQVLFTEITVSEGKRNWFGEVVRVLAVLFGFSSIILFWLGVDAAIDGFELGAGELLNAPQKAK